MEATLNHRKSQPQPLGEHCDVTERHPLVQMGFHGSRHLIPQRLPSAKRERTVALRVLDLNSAAIEQIKDLSPHLKRLDLSSLNLTELDEEIFSSLEHLEKLDLGCNDLSGESFPPCFENLRRLIELSLTENNLCTCPKEVTRLHSLTRLKLADNQLNSLKGVEELKKLKVLVLDNNKLTTLHHELFRSLTNLEILHCSGNSLKDIPSDISHWRFLRELDVSRNNLTSLSPQVFMLPRIEMLCAASNNISHLPTMKSSRTEKNHLATIDLSENKVVTFPSHLLGLTDVLDLSGNQIKTIPGSAFKNLDNRTDRKLLIDDNPLKWPPKDICESGLDCVLQFVQEANANEKILQGLKVLLLGASGQGKTSLVKTILDQQPRLTETERSFGVDIFEYGHEVGSCDEPTLASTTEDGIDNTVENQETDQDSDQTNSKILKLSFWDFAGHPRYAFPNYLFLEQPSLVLLVFNMARYTPSKFYPLVGYYIDLILSKSNSIVLVPVGTHSDKLRKSKVDKICTEVLASIHKHLAEHTSSIQEEIKRIEDKPHISPALSEQLKGYISLLQVRQSVHEKVIALSSANANGFKDLLRAIEENATDKILFPQVLRTIPSLWGDVEAYVEELGMTLTLPILPWSEFVDKITSKFGMKRLITAITGYLHDSGAVLWFSSHHILKDIVILKPSWFTDVVKQVFRHDVAEMDYYMEDGFKAVHVNRHKFERLQKQVLDEGIFDKDYLKSLWNELHISDQPKPDLDIIGILVEMFEVGYGLTRHLHRNKPSGPQFKDSAGSAGSVRSVRFNRRESAASSAKSNHSLASPERPPSNLTIKTDSSVSTERLQTIVIPWLRDTPQPEHFDTVYETTSHMPCLAAVFQFPKFTPPGLYETFTVHCQKPQFGITLTHQWRWGCYGLHKEKNVRVFLQRIEREDTCNRIRIEVRLEKPPKENADRPTDPMWAVLLPLVNNMDTLISTFKGARVVRLMECPKCKADSFLGEWKTPKELQNLTTKKCEACNEEVGTEYIIQAQDRRRVELLILRKKQTQDEAKNLAQGTTLADGENQNDIPPPEPPSKEPVKPSTAP